MSLSLVTLEAAKARDSAPIDPDGIFGAELKQAIQKVNSVC